MFMENVFSSAEIKNYETVLTWLLLLVLLPGLCLCLWLIPATIFFFHYTFLPLKINLKFSGFTTWSSYCVSSSLQHSSYNWQLLGVNI